ncbi:MAG: SpoIIE family protein phosphatase [Solirubrobacteraceae bacterium]
MALTLACGGHPPPLLRRRDGEVQPIPAHGTVLGIFDDPAFRRSPPS